MKTLHYKKRKRSKFEQKLRKTGLIVHGEIFVEQRQLVSNLMKSLKMKYYADKIEECGTDQKALFNVINNLQNKRKEMALRSSGSSSELPDIFNKKISQIRQKLDSDSCTDISFTVNILIFLWTHLDQQLRRRCLRLIAKVLKSMCFRSNISCIFDRYFTYTATSHHKNY